ncbi:GNAT family N-acetyltransferase [Pantoea sp. SJZ147]|uniref:GNAT family N-acetyltransferase n=1 Tax=Pantoea sp. SJZ147 TaxID=2572896 RepID=UPI0011A64C6E|nr:GNAT family N-acetyltransferase [Pantoea sp. SJZ147]TWD37585.1 RimJ/RimL family protein N-acetyltransferase [Pantoea sp. SJZ147]
MTPMISTLRLRPFDLHDIEAFTEAVNDSLDTLLPWMSWAHQDYQPHEAESWIRFTHLQRALKEAEEFAIVDAENRLLGGAGFRFAKKPGEFCALGYWVRRDAQCQGVATQAVKLLLDFGFARPDVQTIELLAVENNYASRRVAEKSGGHFIDYRYGVIILDSGPVNAAIYHFQRPCLQ